MKKGNIFAIFATILLVLGCTQVIPLDITETPKPDTPSNETVDIEMVFVEGGTFTMGATEEQGNSAVGNEKPAHQVTLSDFYIGKYEVTQAQWEAIMGSNPSNYVGNVLPVENVSWNDIQEFVTKLNEQTGKNFRLPTEAEWEYAARGGNKSQGYKYSGGNNVGEVAWYNDNSGKTTHPVGHNRSNELGIYDMSGNVSEWCSDWYGSYSSDAQTNPTGPTTGSNRVARGGSCNDFANYCRVSYRSWGRSDYRGNNHGFRLACSDRTTLTAKIAWKNATEAIVTWSTFNWSNHANDFTMAYTLEIKKGSELVVKWHIPANYIWDPDYSKEGCRFIVSGLEPETEYTATVANVTEGVSADPVKFTTDASKVVELPATPAAAGDVILHEDFSMLLITADLSRYAAGYSYDKRSEADSSWKATGDDPVSTQTDWGCCLVDPSTEVGCFNTIKGVVKTSRLATWGMMAEDDTKGAICARPGYLKMGASSKCAWIVTPELTCLAQPAKIEVSFDAALYQSDPRTCIVEILTGCTQESHDNNSFVRPTDRFTAANFEVGAVAGEWAHYTFTVDNVMPGSRVAIGADRAGVDGQHRFYIDNIEVKVLSYGQLTLTAPANLALTATDTTIEATWDAVANTKEYVVEYKAKDAAEWTALAPVAETKATITGLAFETEYEVRVKATADDVASDYSEVATIKTLAESSAVNIEDFEMVFVEGGTFTMGATSEQGSDAQDREKPAHQVTVSDFYIGKYEVTQAQWRAVMGSNPSYFTGDNLPVEQVSWNDIQEFITKLNEQTGKNFRLPTEAEWEYAARGGNKSQGYKYSGSNTIDDVAWYWDNSSSTTHPVGQKQPNELGLYDMSGNVYEWCYDWYGDYSSDAQTNPTGPGSGSHRVVRGGSWSSYARYCRVSNRNYFSADFRNYRYGFRLVCSPE